MKEGRQEQDEIPLIFRHSALAPHGDGMQGSVGMATVGVVSEI